MRLKNWLRTVPSLAIIGTILFGVLAVGGGLLLWGNNVAENMVHDQLAAQEISFPEKGSEGFDAKTYPGLQQYAGQAVDSGPKAKAYANEYIAVHLNEIGGGKTSSQLTAESRAKPDDQELAGAVQTTFRGETLRGLLLRMGLVCRRRDRLLGRPRRTCSALSVPPVRSSSASCCTSAR